MDAKIVVLAGDGIGPEVTAEARKVLEAVGKKYGHAFSFDPQLMGGNAIDNMGTSLPDATVAACSDGGRHAAGRGGRPQMGQPQRPRPARAGAVGASARSCNLFANVRPVKLHPQLIGASTLKEEMLQGVDMVVIRELTGGVYFGPRQEAGDAGYEAYDTMLYTAPGDRARGAAGGGDGDGPAQEADQRGQGQCLASSRLWRRVATAGLGRLSGAGGGACAGGCDGDAPDPPPRRLRRDRDREPLWRHPHRRGVDAGRVDGHVALRQFGRHPQQSRPAAGPVRADPRQRAGHRRAGASPTRWRPSSARLCCCVTAWGWNARPTRWKPRSMPCWTKASARRTSPTPAREVVGTTVMGDLVVGKLLG